MKTELHLELVMQIRTALANIKYLQRRSDKSEIETKDLILEEREKYEALREKLCSLPIEDTDQNTTIEGGLTDLEQEHFTKKHDRP